MASHPAPRIVLVGVTWHEGTLAVLGSTARGAPPPIAVLGPAQAPADAAEALARRALGRPPAWLSQVGVLREAEGLTIIYAAVVAVPSTRTVGDDLQWRPLTRGAAPASVRAAIAHLRERIDREPVAFRLLGASFTLSDLQRVYESLLERHLHKASFRRSLMAAHLVEPTDQWRSEGRGRPAQLFRYAPRRRRGPPRAVRFDLVS
jgi:ADP-ribose pyrophosphatase YjhB (NUDIX family)